MGEEYHKCKDCGKWIIEADINIFHDSKIINGETEEFGIILCPNCTKNKLEEKEAK